MDLSRGIIWGFLLRRPSINFNFKSIFTALRAAEGLESIPTVWAKLGNSLNKSPVHHRANTKRWRGHTHLQTFEVHLGVTTQSPLCMSLDCEWNPQRHKRKILTNSRLSGCEATVPKNSTTVAFPSINDPVKILCIHWACLGVKKKSVSFLLSAVWFQNVPNFEKFKWIKLQCQKPPYEQHN